MDTKDIILELKTKIIFRRMNWRKRFLLQGRRFPAGKTVKPCLIPKL